MGWSGRKFSVFYHCPSPLSLFEPSLLTVGGEGIPAVAHANSMYAAIQVGSVADWVPSCAEEVPRDAAKHSCTSVQTCSSYRKKLGQTVPLCFWPLGAHWDKVATWCCSFMEPNGPMLCWEDEKNGEKFCLHRISFNFSPHLMAAYFYNKECSFLKCGLFQSPFTSTLKLATDLVAFGSGP